MSIVRARSFRRSDTGQECAIHVLQYMLSCRSLDIRVSRGDASHVFRLGGKILWWPLGLNVFPGRSITRGVKVILLAAARHSLTDLICRRCRKVSSARLMRLNLDSTRHEKRFFECDDPCLALTLQCLTKDQRKTRSQSKRRS